MLNKAFLETLTPVEIQMIHQYINILFKDKINEKTGNYENLEGTIERCPYCGSKHIVKNGHSIRTKRQKYLCRDCGEDFCATTSSFFHHSRIGYYTWITFIACEIVGLSLRDEAQITGRSVTTCFNMRHKLYDALRDYQGSQKQEGLCEIDATYTSINLKGQKHNMPRFSKKRGKHKPDPKHPNLRGISHHKICMITSIDENDHILFKIAGLGPETFDMYNKYKSHFSKGAVLVCDDRTCIKSFAKENGLSTDVIPSGAFKSASGNTVATLNQLHQSFSELIRKKHGVSTRHLQGYIDWLVMTKQLRYRLEARKMNTQIYMDIMRTPVSFTTKQICSLTMPVDVYAAYREYNFCS